MEFQTEEEAKENERSQGVALLEHIGRLPGMLVSGYRGRRFEPRQQYVVSLSQTLYPQCFSRLICEMSTRWDNLMKDVQCYELFGGIALKNHAFSFLITVCRSIEKRHGV